MSETLASGGLKADRRSRRAYVLRGKGWVEVEALRAKEFDLLWLLLSHEDQHLDRAHLLAKLWGGDGKDSPAAVDRQVGSLRKKLGPQGVRIVSVYGRGYALLGSSSRRRSIT